MKFFNLHSVKSYILSALFSILATLVLLGVISIVFAFFPPKEWLLHVFEKYCIYLTAFLASFLCARTKDGHGLIAGVIAAVFCILILLSAGYIFFESGGILSRFIRLLPLSALAGAIGGVLGINSK